MFISDSPEWLLASIFSRFLATTPRILSSFNLSTRIQTTKSSHGASAYCRIAAELHELKFPYETWESAGAQFGQKNRYTRERIYSRTDGVTLKSHKDRKRRSQERWKAPYMRRKICYCCSDSFFFCEESRESPKNKNEVEETMITYQMRPLNVHKKPPAQQTGLSKYPNPPWTQKALPSILASNYHSQYMNAKAWFCKT